MSGDDNIEDINAALARAMDDPEIVAITDLPKRRKREKRMQLSPDDGRCKKATGRTKQFNCDMRPELHRRIVQASRLSGKTIVRMCEEAFLAYLAHLEGAR
jgi:hypothetical protein